TRLRQVQAAAAEALTKQQRPVELNSEFLQRNPIIAQIASSYLYSPDEVRIVTRLYPPHDSEHDWASSIPKAFEDALSNEIDRQVAIEIAGGVTIQEELRNIITKDLAKVVLIVLACTVVYLIIYFENFSRALLSILPVVLALMCMLGTVHLFG